MRYLMMWDLASRVSYPRKVVCVCVGLRVIQSLASRVVAFLARSFWAAMAFSKPIWSLLYPFSWRMSAVRSGGKPKVS